MPQITLRDWRLSAATDDTDILKLNVESTDGTDIIEVAQPESPVSRENEPFVLRFTTERLEAEQQEHPGRRAEPEPDEDAGSGWEIDDEETIYTRGWEVNALVDDDGVLTVEIERPDDAEIYPLEPIESGVPQPSPLVVRLAAEEEIDDEDEDEEENEEPDEDVDDFDELEELNEKEDDYAFDDSEDELSFEDLFEEDEEEF